MKIKQNFCKCCNSLLENNILVKDKIYFFCGHCNSVVLDDKFYLTSENHLQFHSVVEISLRTQYQDSMS